MDSGSTFLVEIDLWLKLFLTDDHIAKTKNSEIINIHVTSIVTQMITEFYGEIHEYFFQSYCQNNFYINEFLTT